RSATVATAAETAPRFAHGHNLPANRCSTEREPWSTERCTAVSTTPYAPSAVDSSLSTTRSAVFGRRWLRGAAVVRILYRVLWACDATFNGCLGSFTGRSARGARQGLAGQHPRHPPVAGADKHDRHGQSARLRGGYRDRRDARGPGPDSWSDVECRVRRH